jgi:predicted enzyme related to lactoylglutathione lyase
MTAPVARRQIVTPQAQQAADFYRGLFGWTVKQDNALGYREVAAGKPGPDGGIWPAPPGAKGFVQLFVEVPDIDACIARATHLGGTVVVPRSELPDGDAMAVLSDPTGISVGLCTLRRRG